MLFVFLIIGAILIVVAIRNTYGDLFTALGQDVPDFVVWGAAIVALGVIGFVPGLKPISKGLLALVLLVIILRNYQAILAGFNNAWASGPSSSSASPSSSLLSSSPSSPMASSNLLSASTGGTSSATASSTTGSSITPPMDVLNPVSTSGQSAGGAVQAMTTTASPSTGWAGSLSNPFTQDFNSLTGGFGDMTGANLIELGF